LIVGGGIAQTGLGPLTIRNTAFVGNTAGAFGGGLYNVIGTTIVDDSKFIHNGTLGLGGGISTAGPLTLRHSEVNDNRANGALGAGAGIASLGSTVNLIDSTVNDNVATNPPGGFLNGGSTVTVDPESVIVGNRPTNCLGSPTPVPTCFG
jgi:hypothetical protein